MFPLLFAIAAVAQTAFGSPEEPVGVPQVRQAVETCLGFLEKD